MPRLLLSPSLPLLLAACHGTADLDLGWVLPDARVGLAYETWLGSADEEGSWALVGDGPPGLELTSDGWLVGTPTSSGDFDIEVAYDPGRGDEWLASYALHIPPVALLSGYEPFGGHETNPSILALWPLQEELLGSLDLRVVELPVVWDVAWDVLLDEIELLDPTVVIATGMAGTDAMRFETRAQNVQYGTDNEDQVRWGAAVVDGGPDELSDALPEAEMSAAMEAGGFPTTISDDAGTFLCNDVFYQLMYHAAYLSERELVAGFIHVSPAQTGYDYAVEDITDAHRLGLQALSDWMQSGQPQAARVRASTHAAPVYFP